MKEPQKVKSWRLAALLIYFRAHGRRCVDCSFPVDLPDAELWYTEADGGTYVLTHKKGHCLTS